VTHSRDSKNSRKQNAQVLDFLPDLRGKSAVLLLHTTDSYGTGLRAIGPNIVIEGWVDGWLRFTAF